MLDNCKKLLSKYFGYEEFRPGQEAVVMSVINKKDTFVVMPTGGGKSLCYQIPALVQEGITLVISPLIALMKDQVDTLNSIGVGAAFINSTLTTKEIEERLTNADRGKYKLLYISPERLESESFCFSLRSMKIEIIAIDEAHCVSQWGHDFRPSYRNISNFIKTLINRPVIMALTATATETVRHDIIALLELQRPTVVITGFDRSNLKFSVINGENKKEYIKEYISDNKNCSGIIYTATRREAEDIYGFLVKSGSKVALYHAGLSDKERNKAQEDFIYDEVDIMIATNAFGMGIDKSNIRFVIHHNMPKNMEAYYQEAGRAGRDGEYSECILLYNPGDVQTQKFFINEANISAERKVIEYQRLQKMVDYCHTSVCLRKNILEYFGETNSVENCHNCSVCTDDNELKDITKEAQMILSCIYRARERYGKTMIIDVLKGSKNKKLLEARLNELSTYGIMINHDKKDLNLMLNKLAADGYLRFTEEAYPVIKLTNKSLPVLKNNEKVYMKLKVSKVKHQESEKLFEILKQLRKEIANRENLPPYIIFHDTTLKEICSVLPLNLNKLGKIKGMGERKLNLYGEEILSIISNYVKEMGIDLQEETHNQMQAVKAEKEEDRAEKMKSHIITYNLYMSGMPISEITKIRGLTSITIEGHIFQAYSEGYDINLDDFIPKEAEGIILKVINELKDISKLKPIKENLPDNISYTAIKAVIYKHKVAI
jgi:ATP-dependent DNA helicase RecQ